MDTTRGSPEVRMDRKQRCVKLSVQPSRGLMDEKFLVLVQNVLPGFQLTVYAFYRCDDGHSWEAFAHYTANASGTVNVSEDHSLGGTYSGVEPMGLMWSLRPVPGSKPGLRMRKMNVQTPMEVTISVYRGHLTGGFVDQVPLAGVVVERWYMAPGVRRVPVTEGGLTATLFLPSGPGPFPGLLDLWGGGGKLVEYRAALLASHGIASLALDYLTPQITKETGKMVDNRYFEAAYRFLEQHPQVLGSRIGILGLSFGTSIALKMAVYSPVFKLRCAVCISGSHVQPIEGSVQQIMTSFHKNADKTRFNEEHQVIWRDLLLPIPTDPSLKVEVGRLRCPLLLVVGEDDQNWPAHESAVDVSSSPWRRPPPVCRSPDRTSLHAVRPRQQLQDPGPRPSDVDGSVGRRDCGTFPRSGGRLEEDAGLSEGESVRRHEPRSHFLLPPVTRSAPFDSGASACGSGSTDPLHRSSDMMLRGHALIDTKR
ncbi:acyl-coenzyme A thioesterase 1-like isoform X2 [Pungitius pungitius]|uniref:acyl-coenzyme A thioesterase 1-like isoform X2 n=1 Tax=Pungitius pungitius TaxID=134920 RepID=UPI002E12E653